MLDKLDDPIIQDFVLESKEILDKVSEQLTFLEESSSDKAIIDSMFRSFHTIKGGAGFLNFPYLVEICHLAESVLDGIRKDKYILSTDIIDAILKTCDSIYIMFAQIKDCIVPNAASKELQDRLKNIAANSNNSALQQNLTYSPNAVKPTFLESTIRVEITKIDNLIDMVGELNILCHQLAPIKRLIGDNTLLANLHELNALGNKLHNALLKTRVLPARKMVVKIPRLVKELAKSLSKEVELLISGDNIEVDRHLIDSLADPLLHMVRNALDHGIEGIRERLQGGKLARGIIEIAINKHNDFMEIKVKDDGKGIDVNLLKKKALEKNLVTHEELLKLTDKECLNFILMPGFSTKEEVSAISGRGVGMDVVRNRINQLHGELSIDSVLNQGTTVALRVPLAVSVLSLLLVQVDKYILALPVKNIIKIGNYNSNKKGLPLFFISNWLNVTSKIEDKKKYILQINFEGRTIGLVVDSLLGKEELMVKNLSNFIPKNLGITGAAITKKGTIALVIDCYSFVNKYLLEAN